MRAGYRAAGMRARVEPFLDTVAEEMRSSDAVVCRAGATTLAEVAASGRPALIVPLPRAAHDHQRRNAAVLAEAGAAEVVEEAVLRAELAPRLLALLGDPARRSAMSEAARRLARPDAARRVVDRIERLAGIAPADRTTGERGEPVREGVRRIHMVGIGGVGMSAIAEILLDRGYEVSGSDAAASAAVDRLRAAGATVSEGHHARQVGPADLLVFSSAVPRDNPELVAAARRDIPVIGRGAMLAELAATRRTIAVAGSHGKTTTTSMITVALEAAGVDPPR